MRETQSRCECIQVAVGHFLSAPMGLASQPSKGPHAPDVTAAAADWLVRPYDPTPKTGDEDACVYLWLKSYAHSRYGTQLGAHIDATPAERRYWDEHQPLVLGLLRNEDTRIACDPERPRVILGFACTTGDDLVHYVVVKRSAVKAGFGPELMRELLGTRLTRRCYTTFEQTELRRDQSGVSLPEEWRRADPLWIWRRERQWRRVA